MVSTPAYFQSRISFAWFPFQLLSLALLSLAFQSCRFPCERFLVGHLFPFEHHISSLWMCERHLASGLHGRSGRPIFPLLLQPREGTLTKRWVWMSHQNGRTRGQIRSDLGPIWSPLWMGLLSWWALCPRWTCFPYSPIGGLGPGGGTEGKWAQRNGHANQLLMT